LPPPSHRLDLCLLPPAAVDPKDSGPVLLATWRARGWVQGDGPGPRSGDLIEGGFVRCWLDLAPEQRLYANQQGGYKVSCPVEGGSLISEFQPTLRLWRGGGGGPRTLACSHCGGSHDLDELDYQPPAGVALGAIMLADVSALTPGLAAVQDLEQAWGGVRIVWRRVGR
jgi:hypothetical protein